MSSATQKKSIHAVWLGGEMPPFARACLDDWRKQGYRFKVWTDHDKDVQAWIDGCRFAKVCYQKRLFAFVSDYIRLKVLEQEGGLYLDTDVTIRQNPFPLFNKTKFAVGYEDEFHLGTAIIYAEPDSEVLAKIIRFYEERIWHSSLYIGPQILTQVIRELDAPQHECLLLPRPTFYPNQLDLSDTAELNKSYAVHWFQHSWKRARGLIFLKSKHQGFWGKLYTWQKYAVRGHFR